MSGPCLRVLHCGGAVSLQDGGRRGYQRYGLSASGPMDRLAMAAANVLVGNPADAPVIELGLGGARFRIEGASARLALAGATCPVRADGAPVAMHASFSLTDGSELAVAPPRDGAFAYLAVRGGFAVPLVLGSASLHLRAGLGGLDGQLLRGGDCLALAEPGIPPTADCALDPVRLDRDESIRIVLGPQADHFTESGIATLLGETFRVTHRADRMGYQLDGPCIAHAEQGYNIISDGTVAGAIQVPGSGRPIVLMADRQTTGGYPKIATIVSADLRRIAQRRPGDAVRFEAVSLDAAVTLARRQATELSGLADTLRAVSPAEYGSLLAANVAGHAVDALAEPD